MNKTDYAKKLTRGRGQPSKPPEQVRQNRTLRFTPVELREIEIAALQNGYVDSKGKPKVAQWLVHASNQYCK